MKRDGEKGKLRRARDTFRVRGLAISLAGFFVLVVGFLLIFSEVDKRSDGEQAARLREAVRRAVVSCYAIEGRYPVSAEYLKEHYALRYDEERYIVSLDSFASNICPDIRVLRKGAVIR